MNLKQKLAQVEETKTKLQALTESQFNFVTRMAEQIQKSEPDFEITDFIHNDSYPCSHDWFHLVQIHVDKAMGNLTAGRVVVAVKTQSGDWMINLENPMGEKNEN